MIRSYNKIKFVKNCSIDISIIVPTFNVEEYLSECVESLL